MSESYADLGGQPFNRWTLPKTIPCPTCHAQIGEKCVNPLSGLPSHMACIARRPEVTA